ncbi:MAG: menaquinone biosynthesis decarboxylase [Thermoplasmata archaeon]|nr:MAG: menaquinone biosynthesis decarboxylase [Aciduliprofundum sp.]
MKDLRYSIERLRKINDLLDINERFSSDLQVSIFTDEVQRRGGPALLFHDVDGSGIPVLMNAFGTKKRLEYLLGREIEDISNYFSSFIEQILSKPSISQGISLYRDLKVLHPTVHGSGPVKDMQGDLKLSDIPILKTWPGDGGRYITLPVVITKDPENGSYNAGVYRMQVYDDETTGMHWQRQKTGYMHMLKAKKLGKTLDVAVAIGVNPSILFSAISPLPEGLNEMSFAGLLMNEEVDLVKGETVDLLYPSNAEFVLEGYVDPDESRAEGPFGDHTGYYTPVEDYPVFHIKRIFHRKNPIYHATVVGRFWSEDAVIADAIQSIFLPFIKLQNQEIVDLYLPEEGVFNDLCIVSIRKSYPGQARKVAMSILSSGQLMFTKYVIVVDDDINVRDRREVLWAVSTRTDPARDVEIIGLSVADSLDHASIYNNAGGKMIIDATVKMPQEGFNRPWPRRIEKDLGKIVESMLRKYGFE